MGDDCGGGECLFLCVCVCVYVFSLHYHLLALSIFFSGSFCMN